MRQLLALKWRLMPLVVAVAVLMIPVAGSVLDHNRAATDAKAAEIILGSRPRPGSRLQGLPSKIIIPSLSIDLAVVTQHYSPSIKSWPVSPSTANYAAETPLINNTRGQSLIYGHDTRGIFGPLVNLKPGAAAYVYTSDGHVFKYTFTGSTDISPQKIGIVDKMARMPAGLSLITCSGEYFQYRHLMAFRLLQAS